MLIIKEFRGILDANWNYFIKIKIQNTYWSHLSKKNKNKKAFIKSSKASWRKCSYFSGKLESDLCNSRLAKT